MGAVGLGLVGFAASLTAGFAACMPSVHLNAVL